MSARDKWHQDPGLLPIVLSWACTGHLPWYAVSKYQPTAPRLEQKTVVRQTKSHPRRLFQPRSHQRGFQRRGQRQA